LIANVRHRTIFCCSRVRVIARYIITLVAAFGIFQACAAQGAGHFKIQQRWTIGGAGSWDYLTVDAAANRLYIAHQTRVEVVDLDSGKVVGSIQGLTRCHGIVIAPGGATGFISDGGANSIVVFDPASLKTLGTIPAGTNPDGMVYEPATQTLWAFNGGSKNATVIDVAERKPVATVAMPGKPEFPASDGSGTLFVNVEDSNSVVRIDAKSRQITATWKLTGCESPSGLAIDVAGERLFSVCEGKKMAITDAHTGKSLATPTIGDGADATAYDPAHRLVFASNEDGTLSVIDTSQNDYPVIQTLRTMKGARTMALNASNGKVYTVSAKLGALPAANPTVHHNRPAAIPGTFMLVSISTE
jgi:DNA-binding beta-propeller fold protein YncE